MTEELRPSEVARRLGTSTRTVQRWIESGRLPARRVGGRWRVAIDAFDVFRPETDPPRSLPGGSPGEFSISAVFVANRGEIAERIRRTCERLGVRVTVPETDGPNALDLLDVDAVVAAAITADTDAVHPGFGFLAEHAGFADAVLAAGLRWVGPPPGAIRAMGDKAASRRLAASLGIPIPAGYQDADQSDAAFARAAEGIGYPLLIKPAAGGGGKGMRTVREPRRLADDLAAARREAMAAFGDDRLVLERLVEGARHVEIQVLFDGHGGGVHLGERDCSLQRRHQKILEEAGSPAVDADLRDRMGAAALALAAAVGYVNAGTCEFLLDDRGDFTFLEMNTRLQVEHPVTELVTGRDLVADQLRIATGASLGFTQDEVVVDGHAVEVRLYAEDAEAGFLPATGTIERLRWPAGPGIRVDAGVRGGDTVGSRFDPMLAKIVARGADRDEALERLTRALDETVVLGLTTNLRFLRWLVREPVVRDGDARTDTLERIWPPDDWRQRTRIPDAAWAAAARVLLAAAPGDRTDAPTADGFRLNAAPTLRLATDDDVRTVRLTPGSARTRADTVRVDDTVHLDLAGRSVAFRLAPPPDVDRAATAAAAHAGGAAELMAPMPGQVLAVHVALGDDVVQGDPIITLEAMKMEHVVAAPRSGRVRTVAVAPGDQVARGAILGVIGDAD